MSDIIAAADQSAATTLLHDAETTLGTLSKSGAGGLSPFVAGYSATVSFSGGNVDLIPPNVIQLSNCHVNYSLSLSFGLDLNDILPSFCLPQVCIFGWCTPKICVSWPTVTIPVSFSDSLTTRPAAEGTPSEQHTVMVSHDSGSLKVSPSELEIRASDGVLWYAADAMVSGFNVTGASADFHFDSARIHNGAVFTHTFGVPGSYEWLDPNGSGVNGTIEVIAFGGKSAEDRDQWFEMLKRPAGIKITGKAVSRPRSPSWSGM